MIIKRVGGKSKLAKWICDHMPTCSAFVDVFGGSGAVLDGMQKSRSRTRFVYNDLDGAVVSFFMAMQSQPFELANAINLLPYSRKIFEHCYKTLKSDGFQSLSILEQAITFLVVNRQSFGAKMDSTWSITRDGEVNYDTWRKLPTYILDTYKTWKSTFVENLDYRELLPKWDSPKTCFYLDPPYEGVEDDYYDVNKSEGFDHWAMLEALKLLEGSFCVSYYGGSDESGDTELIRAYADMGCEIERAKVRKHLSASDTKEKAVEILIVKHNEWSSSAGVIKKTGRGKGMKELS